MTVTVFTKNFAEKNKLQKHYKAKGIEAEFVIGKGSYNEYYKKRKK